MSIARNPDNQKKLLSGACLQRQTWLETLQPRSCNARFHGLAVLERKMNLANWMWTKRTSFTMLLALCGAISLPHSAMAAFFTFGLAGNVAPGGASQTNAINVAPQLLLHVSDGVAGDGRVELTFY